MEIAKRQDVPDSIPNYTEVEWLECTGDQFIDLGQTFGGMTVNATFALTLDNWKQSPWYWFCMSTELNRCWFDAVNTVKNGLAFSDDNYNRVAVDTTNFPYIHTFNFYPSENAKRNLFVFTDYTGSMQRNLRVYGIKIKRTAQDIIANLIPVRFRDQGCLYDCVSKRLFGNAGSDEFIIGPDKEM